MATPKMHHTDMILELNRLEYHPGETIHGKLSIKVKASTKFRNIRVEIAGIEHTHVEKFAHAAASGWGYRAVSDLGPSESYWHYRHAITVDGHPMKSGEKEPILLDEGDRVYNFALPLPKDLPPSFKAGDGQETSVKLEHGQVAMTYMAVPIIEFEDGTYECMKKTFAVSPIPMNEDQHDSSPHGIELKARVHVNRLALLDGGHVKLHAKVDRTMLSPGVDEFALPLEVDLTECKGAMEKGRLSLVRYTHVHAKTDDDDEQLVVSTSAYHDHPIPSKQKGVIRLTMGLPKGIVPSVQLVGTTVRYEIHVELVFSGCADIKYGIPVTICPSELDKSNSQPRFDANAVHVHSQAQDKKKFIETVCYERSSSRNTSFVDLTAAAAQANPDEAA